MKGTYVFGALAAALLLGGALLAGPSIFAPAASPDAAPVAAAPPNPIPATQKTVTLKVDNMWCASCPYIVKQVLARVPGVISAKVSFRDQSAVVTYDSAKADPSALIAATTDYGYPSAVIE